MRPHKPTCKSRHRGQSPAARRRARRGAKRGDARLGQGRAGRPTRTRQAFSPGEGGRGGGWRTSRRPHGDVSAVSLSSPFRRPFPKLSPLGRRPQPSSLLPLLPPLPLTRLPPTTPPPARGTPHLRLPPATSNGATGPRRASPRGPRGADDTFFQMANAWDGDPSGKGLQSPPPGVRPSGRPTRRARDAVIQTGTRHGTFPPERAARAPRRVPPRASSLPALRPHRPPGDPAIHARPRNAPPSAIAPRQDNVRRDAALRDRRSNGRRSGRAARLPGGVTRSGVPSAAGTAARARAAGRRSACRARGDGLRADPEPVADARRRRPTWICVVDCARTRARAIERRNGDERRRRFRPPSTPAPARAEQKAWLQSPGLRRPSRPGHDSCFRFRARGGGCR